MRQRGACCDPKGLNPFILGNFLLLLSEGLAESHLAHCSLSRLIELNPALVPHSSPEVIHVRRREKPILAKAGITGEKWPVKFSLTM
jgi:hypothetical protein